MTQFAKLFETDEGQVLVTKDTNDEGAPCLLVHFVTEGGHFGKLVFSYEDTDTGWASLDEVFESCTLEDAENAIGDLRGVV